NIFINPPKMAKSLARSPPSFIWWTRNEMFEQSSDHPSPRRSSLVGSEPISRSDSGITLPTQGTATPTSPLTEDYSEHTSMGKESVITSNPDTLAFLRGAASPDIRHRIENASPETARQVALRMYESMKRHGLRGEAGRVMDKEDDSEIREVKEGVDEDRRSEELMGMEYLLRDGFVSYLRDMAKITPPIPQQVVRFSNIKYSRKLEISGNEYETFGNKLVGCLVGPFKSLLQRKNSTWSQSSLLEILAGRTKMTKNTIFDGMVKYNNKNATEIQLSRLIAYISGQLNRHIPFLTVRETLEFARDCTQGLQPESFTPQMRKFFAHALVEGQDPFLEYVLEILGLKEIQQKLAGDEISDTDRQKLTTAELALGTYSVMLYDQPFSGSDLAATYSLVDTIRTISRIQQSSAVMSLTQLSQEPTNVETNEFLEDIAAGHGFQYMEPGATSWTLDELVECYKFSDHYKDIRRIVERAEVKQTYWVESEPGLGLSLKQPAQHHYSADAQQRQETELVVAKLSSNIGHSGGIESTGRVQVGDVVTAISMHKEETQYLSIGPQNSQHERVSYAYSMLKNAPYHVRLQAIVLGMFAGTLFYKLGGQYNQQKMNSIRALGFVSTMSIMLINLVQLPLYMLQRPIFYKHKTQRFFRVSSYIVSHCIVNLPQTLMEALAYTLSVYFKAGLSLAGSLIVSIFLLFSGFVIYPSNIPTYWKWLIYLNPIYWANVSFCMFQFDTRYTDPCSNYLDQLPFCNQFPIMTVGKAYLAFYQLSEHSERPWLPYHIEFSGTNQSLPHLQRSQEVNKYEQVVKGSPLQSSFSENPDSFGDSMHPLQTNSVMGYPKSNDHAGADLWMEEFRINLERNGMGIPIQPVTLLFECLSFTRFNEVTKESTIIFTNITGYVKPQLMLAILGGTRTSKGTLLKCLAGRIPFDGNLSGNLQANGIRAGATFSRLIGYVEKLDAHQPFLSVRESLQFSAALRLGQDISSRSRNIHVESILHQLNLLPYANQLVGALRGAAGKAFEIAKRITIAVELAANPSVLLLEEPTTGLDATGTSAIRSVLTQISNSGRVTIATLTHPNARMLSSFDLALILTKDGRQAYFGPVGYSCNKLIGYFTSIRKAPSYSTRASPISFVMGTLGLGIKKEQGPPLNYAEIYQASALQDINKGEILNIKKLIKDRTLHYQHSAYPVPYSRQAIWVLVRTQRFLWRNVQYTYGRLTGCIMVGLLMGTLYFQIEYEDIYGATSRTLYIYMQAILIGVISANNVIPQIGTDRLVYFRERRTRMYLPIFYPLSWAVGEIPYIFTASLAVVAIGNGLAGIATGSLGEFLVYWLVLSLFTVCVTYFGMMITFLAPVPTLAAFAVSIVTSMWVSASGVVVVLSDIRFYQWIYWSNPFQFAMNVMTSISFYCDTKSCLSDCSCPKFPDGSYVWDRISSSRSLNHERMDIDILVLCAMCVLFAMLAFLFFVVLKHNWPQQL
ncbi:hypothetical protein Tsubulata_030481, partial [Turnera subulata]